MKSKRGVKRGLATKSNDSPLVKKKVITKKEEKNEELVEIKQRESNKKEYVFKSLREEILRRASWKNGVTVTGLTGFLVGHPEANRMTSEIHSLENEGLITIIPIQIKQEAALFGGSFQTLLRATS